MGIRRLFFIRDNSWLLHRLLQSLPVLLLNLLRLRFDSARRLRRCCVVSSADSGSGNAQTGERLLGGGELLFNQ